MTIRNSTTEMFQSNEKLFKKRGKNLQKKLSEDYIEYDNDYYLYVSLYVEYDNKIDKYKVIDTYVKMDGLVSND